MAGEILLFGWFDGAGSSTTDVFVPGMGWKAEGGPVEWASAGERIRPIEWRSDANPVEWSA